MLREELDTYRPTPRAVLAARYGGEERLAELIKLGREYTQLMATYQEAQKAMKETKTAEPERKLAFKKAAGALGYFCGYYGEERDLQIALQDADLAAEFGKAPKTEYRSVDMPDVATWIGEAETEKLLTEAYALPVKIELSPGSRTGGLARRMLLAGKLKPARLPWSLLSWPGDTVDTGAARELVVLYDAVKLQFPDLAVKQTGDSDWSRNRNLASLAYALAASGRMDEAVPLITQAGPDSSGLPYHAHVTEEVAAAAWDLVMRAFGDTQNVQGWTALKDLAGPANRTSELTTFAAKQAAAAPKGTESAKVWQTRHGWALIGEEKIDDGLAILTPPMDSRPAADEKRWATEWAESATRLFLLAKSLPRPELAKTWSDKLLADFKKTTGPAWKNNGLFNAFASPHLDAGNFALIEEILRARLAAGEKPAVREGLHEEGEREERPNLETTLEQLADVLGRQGRHAEVLALLAESPHWDKKDLAQALDESSAPWRALPLVTAEALQAVGRGDEAIAVIEAELIKNGGYDPAYAFYTRIRGAKATPFLEKLAAGDHYEERPLIWLASLQLAAGTVSEAEATVKRAIAIDPSDGEQPKNDRMRAYAVLREVALKRGDTAQAEFLAGVLAAIRRSENADDLASAGLVTRAIKEYQLALESFSDAYCIQSRLARQLAKENRNAEAAEHYKRAFELMPDSFGQVESHCFGCEQAFAGEGAQSIAEKVFIDLASKPTVKPQVYYLLGYLRTEQERWEEAADYFTKAVTADPGYLNAWKKLAGVLPNTLRPRAERDRVAFKLLALDPAGRHTDSETSMVRDLPALWQAYAATLTTGLIVPEKLLPLGDKATKAKVRDDDDNDMNDMMARAQAHPQTPSGRLAKHEILDGITRSLDTLYQWRAASESE